MKTKIFCTNNRQYYTVEKGTTLRELYAQMAWKLDYPMLGAKVNARTVNHDYEFYEPKDVTFFDITSESGFRMYSRSLHFLLCAAVHDLFHGCRVSFEFSRSHCSFARLSDYPESIPEEAIDRIKGRMTELVRMDLPFTRYEIHATDLARMMRERGSIDKAELYETSGMLYETYYEMDDYIDSYCAALVSSTGMLSLFDVKAHEDGLLLVLPQRTKPAELISVRKQPKMMAELKSRIDFLNRLGIRNVGTLNYITTSQRAAVEVGTVIRVTEAILENRIAEIANRIASDPAIRVVLIAGPSSSGKTSTSKRLSIQLAAHLRRPIPISLDNWFVNREDTPLDEKGDYDYESLYALDLQQLNRDLADLLAGKEIQLPTYNFEKGCREYRGKTMKLAPENMLVIEGIHGLNPELTAMIPDSAKFRIYASALTSISLDSHNYISSHDNRLLRRIVRDYQFRGASAQDTIKRWPSVREGEERWIFPFQESADAILNTAMIYEIAAIKPHIIEILRDVPHNCPQADEAQRLLHLLDYFRPIKDDEIPHQSLLREFIGGSVFEL